MIFFFLNMYNVITQYKYQKMKSNVGGIKDSGWLMELGIFDFGTLS